MLSHRRPVPAGNPHPPAVVVAEGVRAHPHARAPVWGTALTIVYLVAVRAWLGGLVHMLHTARHWRVRVCPEFR